MPGNESNHSALHSGSRLAMNSLWNFLGYGVPLVIAVFTIPLLIHHLGMERFGVLTLAWSTIGYFSLFDLGLGRAMTQLVAEKVGAGQVQEIPPLVGTAIFMMGIMGIVGGLIMASLSPWLVRDALKIPPALQGETLETFYLLAFSIPIVIWSAGLRGVLEAYQRFGLVNAIRIPLGAFTFLGPVCVLPFSNSLYPIVVALIVGRLIAVGAYIRLCLRVVPGLRAGVKIQRAMVHPLLSFGGWMTVSKIVGPIMVYMDRFLVAALISLSAVSLYATPYEVVTKLLIVPGAIVGVLFPTFAHLIISDRARAGRLFGRGVTYIFLALFLPILAIVVFAHDGLQFWLGARFAENSTVVLQWLAIGVLINSLAHVPAGFIQGVGRPDITAKLHLLELPFYLAALWLLLPTYGIKGAAIAWVGRVTIDTVALFLVVRWLLPEAATVIRRTLIVVFVGLCLLLVGAILSGAFAINIMYVVVTILFFCVFAWRVALRAEERLLLKRVLHLPAT